MRWVTVKRIFRAWFLDFWRNGFISFSSILMMTFTLFVIGLAMFSGVILATTVKELQDRSNMSVQFVTDAPVERIMEYKASLEALPEVASVQYISREEVLAKFRENNKDNQLNLQALDELGTNPFGANLTINAKDIYQYDAISNFLKEKSALDSEATPIIDKISNFDPRYHAALVRLQNITASAESVGLVVIAIFIIITIAISFNTLRLAIYSSRDEIHVMRLVGAGKGYIRSPFIVEGILYGLIAGVVTLLLFYPLTWWLGSETALFFGGINVFSYYISNFPFFFLVIVGSGVILGAVASYLAVRRYLKV
jgi:cell division transport system permease protein